MAESPSSLLCRAAKSLREEARRYLPGGRDEAFRLAVAVSLEFEAECLAGGVTDSDPATELALNIACAFLGEAPHA